MSWTRDPLVKELEDTEDKLDAAVTEVLRYEKVLRLVAQGHLNARMIAVAALQHPGRITTERDGAE